MPNEELGFVPYCFYVCLSPWTDFVFKIPVLEQQVKTIRDIHLRQTLPCSLYSLCWVVFRFVGFFQVDWGRCFFDDSELPSI
jgi:hypothetical protein